MPEKVTFQRVPYTVRYRNSDGEMQSVRRIPPAKLHEFNNDDVVKISQKRSDNWNQDEEVKIIGVNSRQPNTLWVEDSEGKKTFLPYSDVKGKPKSAAEAEFMEDIRERQRDPLGSDYLLWP